MKDETCLNLPLFDTSGIGLIKNQREDIAAPNVSDLM
jgi:hypothetical protein